MPFVKLDCGILDSTIWFDREAREVFITALLMAEPREFQDPQPQIEIRSLENTGWEVPPGWYGFVPASSLGIIHRAKVTEEAGLTALERLSSPEQESRTPDFEGRRLVRVDGGFIVLNYIKYRERDHSSAERSRRYRARKKARATVASSSHGVAPRDITQAEAEAEAETDVVGGQVVRSSPPAYPPEQRAENATKETIHGLQLRLGGLLCQLSEHENSRLMVPAWCRMVTSYETTRNGETKKHRGVADYRTVNSIDRLERSIEDAEFWVKELEGGRVVE